MAAPSPFGTFLFPGVPFIAQGAVFGTPFGTLLPPGTRVAAYVRSGGPADGDDEAIARMIVPSLKDALRHVRDGRGDTVVVLQDHREDVADASMFDDLAPGTRIVGVGVGTSQPTFTWTSTSASWLIDQSDVVIAGLRLEMIGVAGVQKGISVTASRAAITSNTIVLVGGPSNYAVKGISLSSGSSEAYVVGNRFIGGGGASCDAAIIIEDTSASNRLVAGNYIFGQFNDTTTAPIAVDNASLNTFIVDNVVANFKAGSQYCIRISDYASTGVLARNLCSVDNNGVASSQGITIGASSTFRCFENYCSDEAGKSGVLSPPAVAT